MPLDWKSDSLAEGIRCYRNQEFWLAHEHWERVWLRLREPEKAFLQALILTTAAFHHLQKGNTRGVVSLLHKALRRLEPYPANFEGIDLAQLRKEMSEWLLFLENGAGSQPKNFPRVYPDEELEASS